MIPRALLAAIAPVIALVPLGPVVDRLARRLAEAPRHAPGEAALAPAVDRLGGEVVRLRSRDGVRLTGRWLTAEPEAGWAADAHEAILLLHGWSGSVAPDLVELGPFLRRTAAVLGLDFRGHGGSDDAPATFGLHEVEDVAGALAWLAERGIGRVAIVGSSMGGVTALAAVAVLGDGRLAAADTDPDAPATAVDPPRALVVVVVADSVAPDLATVAGRALGVPFGRRIAGHAFARLAARLGGDPRQTEPIAVIGLIEDVPLLLVHGGADPAIPPADVRRLLAAAPAGTAHLVVEGAGHGLGHAVDPAAYEGAVTPFLREAFLAARS